uniref:Plethodontid modulating factor n=1 Tax=Plectus sambesii TaxID=2011161 RepID=A0A914WYJ4_9BILA
MNRFATLCSLGLLMLFVSFSSVDAIHCFDERQDEIFACADAVQSCFFTGDRETKVLTAAGCGDDSDFCTDDGSTASTCINSEIGTTCCCHQELCNKGFL